MIKRIVPVVVVLAAAGFGAWWLWLRDEEPDGRLLASGTVEATDARLGFEAAGRLTEVAPREGDPVEAGAVLARLDTTEVEARRREAEARLAAARARLHELERGSRPEEVSAARAEAAAARDRMADAERDAARAERLYSGGAVSREAYDKAAVALELARSRLTQAQEALSLVEQGPRAEQVQAQRAAVAQAQAGLASVEATVAKMELLAPFSGRVTVRHREPGEIVAPGAPVLTVTDTSDRWVRIYVREDRLGAVALGAPAVILCDTFPGKEYPGRVVYVASEAEFTPKSVQTQEERVRLVYAVKVRVEEDPSYELKPGLPVDVRLELKGPEAEGA